MRPAFFSRLSKHSNGCRGNTRKDHRGNLFSSGASNDVDLTHCSAKFDAVWIGLNWYQPTPSGTTSTVEMVTLRSLLSDPSCANCLLRARWPLAEMPVEPGALRRLGRAARDCSRRGRRRGVFHYLAGGRDRANRRICFVDRNSFGLSSDVNRAGDGARCSSTSNVVSVVC